MTMQARRAFLIVLAVSLLTGALQRSGAAVSCPTRQRVGVPAPQDILGFVPGDDRQLASWNQVIQYFEQLDQASDRVKFETLGQSTMGKPFVMATISAPENLARLDEYQTIQTMLADPRGLGLLRLRDRKAAQLTKQGKTIVLITCGIHSTEVGSYLSSMLIAHRLATADTPEIQNILRNTIILLVPSLNPDGVDIVKNWYDKTLGTPYEGTSPPELYHKYVGHDDNRDWYAFTQVETQIAVDKIHNVWHPQIVHDIHQQGEFGARFFLPPYMPPVEPNVPKQIVEGYTELGEFMARGMRVAHFTGITTNSTYDAWSPSRAYSHYHGGVRILSETASCKIATPITVKFNQLKKETGYDPQNESATYGPLWAGGEWRLRDITNYMTTAAFLLLRHAAEHREQWLTRFYEIGKQAVRPRKSGELFGFVIPFQFNPMPQLLKALRRGGVEIEAVEPVNQIGKTYLEGSAVVRMAQPYGGFAKALLETQAYPNLRDREGHPISPYDVTAHTLSLLMGVNVKPLYAPLKTLGPYDSSPSAFASFGGNDARARIAIYKSHVPAIDEGWTRWALEHPAQRYPRLTYQSVDDKQIKTTRLIDHYRVVVIPDQSPTTILDGYKASTMPAELTGGLGTRGVKALQDFVEQGGTLVCLNRASTFAIEQFKLPLRDIVADVSEKEFFVPGSILRIEVDDSHALADRMPRETIAWVEDSPVFEVISAPTGIAQPENVHVIARYPANKNPLLSGWLLGEKRVRGKAALVEVNIGKGRIILFGFRPQYRGQSLATYPLFFNALSKR
jgi:hypothetical protein